MIYKIQSSTFPASLREDLHKLSKKYNILVMNEVVFAASKKYDEKVSAKQILKPKSNYFIVEVTDVSVTKESEEVKLWCAQRFTEQEAQQYEAENQSRLHIASQQLELFEKLLKEAVEAQEGGEGLE